MKCEPFWVKWAWGLRVSPSPLVALEGPKRDLWLLDPQFGNHHSRPYSISTWTWSSNIPVWFIWLEKTRACYSRFPGSGEAYPEHTGSMSSTTMGYWKNELVMGPWQLEPSQTMQPASCMIWSKALMSYINNDWKASHPSEDLGQFPSTELGLYPQKPKLFPSASPSQEPDLSYSLSSN